MFNVQTKLRTQSGYSTPRGPSFSSAKNISIDFDSTKLSLFLPKHTSGFKGLESLNPKSSYRLNECSFRSYPQDFVLDDSWKRLNILSRTWSFNGDWFTGRLAELSLFVGLINNPTSNDEVSYYHPKAFEQAVASFITHQYSTYTFMEQYDWVAPLNWKAYKEFPVPACYFDVSPREGLNENTINYFMFPISNKHIIYFEFRPSRLLNKSKADLDKLIDAGPMEELMHNIINSIKLTLSEKEKEHQKAAVSGLENTHLTGNFPALKWSSTEVSSSAAVLETPNK